MPEIRRALISVSDKYGIVDFARSLSSFGVEILSTGGTAKILKGSGIAVVDVSDYTRFPEMMDGRIKTLHPKIHGALLGMRSNAEHREQMQIHDITPIDLVAVNLYPFEKTVADSSCTLNDAIENIDIGGPAMLRSSAKNYPDVTVITDPADYPAVLDEMSQSAGSVSVATNFSLAKKVFRRTSEYDRAIITYLDSIPPGDVQ